MQKTVQHRTASLSRADQRCCVARETGGARFCQFHVESGAASVCQSELGRSSTGVLILPAVTLDAYSRTWRRGGCRRPSVYTSTTRAAGICNVPDSIACRAGPCVLARPSFTRRNSASVLDSALTLVAPWLHSTPAARAATHRACGPANFDAVTGTRVHSAFAIALGTWPRGTDGNVAKHDTLPGSRTLGWARRGEGPGGVTTLAPAHCRLCSAVLQRGTRPRWIAKPTALCNACFAPGATPVSVSYAAVTCSTCSTCTAEQQNVDGLETQGRGAPRRAAIFPSSVRCRAPRRTGVQVREGQKGGGRQGRARPNSR